MSEITDEMCRLVDGVLTKTLSVRAALEAVAPLLRAQGMREALQTCKDRRDYWHRDSVENRWVATNEAIEIIEARILELEKATP